MFYVYVMNKLQTVQYYTYLDLDEKFVIVWFLLFHIQR